MVKSSWADVAWSGWDDRRLIMGTSDGEVGHDGMYTDGIWMVWHGGGVGAETERPCLEVVVGIVSGRTKEIVCSESCSCSNSPRFPFFPFLSFDLCGR